MSINYQLENSAASPPLALWRSMQLEEIFKREGPVEPLKVLSMVDMLLSSAATSAEVACEERELILATAWLIGTAQLAVELVIKELQRDRASSGNS